MKPSEALSKIQKLLPAQFEELVLHLNVDPSLLPGPNASITERATQLIQLCKQKDPKLKILAEHLKAVQDSPSPASKRSFRPSPTLIAATVVAFISIIGSGFAIYLASDPQDQPKDEGSAIPESNGPTLPSNPVPPKQDPPQPKTDQNTHEQTNTPEDLERREEHVSLQLLGKNGTTKTVAIGKIIDGGVPGGDRALWLQKRMERALSKTDATLINLPNNWNGDGVPKGIDLLLQAEVSTHLERKRSIVEVAWEAHYNAPPTNALAKKIADLITFPADLAPTIKKSYPNLPKNEAITIHLDSRFAGGLCLGERTQIWLHSKQDLHVRVFDLYGDDGALLLFPNPDQPDDRIKADETIPLGGTEGFEAITIPNHDTERFLAIASPTRAGLGAFANITGYCVLPSDAARMLHAGQNLPPKSLVSSDGFRLIHGDTCPKNLATDRRQQKTLQVLSSLPKCQL